MFRLISSDEDEDEDAESDVDADRELGLELTVEDRLEEEDDGVVVEEVGDPFETCAGIVLESELVLELVDGGVNIDDDDEAPLGLASTSASVSASVSALTLALALGIGGFPGEDDDDEEDGLGESDEDAGDLGSVLSTTADAWTGGKNWRRGRGRGRELAAVLLL